jgi:hypothetical protein
MHSVSGHSGGGEAVLFLRSFSAITTPITEWKPENAGYHWL